MATLTRRRALLEFVFALSCFILISLGLRLPQFFFLTWIGTWLIIFSLVWHFHRWRKEAKKEGKELLI